ncbi:MAG: DoxX family protein [Solirubrobacterales bacterium]|nr:DoxX family protein [Solirubrobacterales bacterium]
MTPPSFDTALPTITASAATVTAGRAVAPGPLSTTRVETDAAPRIGAGEVRYVWAFARLCLGWTFLWPFLDKLIGLGHETPSAASWLNGGNPTKGFLSGSIGPFSGIYHSIAGDTVVNVLFMAGLLVIGSGLLLGVYMRFACAAGALMLILMWSASLPPANNVFLDEHIIYATLLAGLALVGADRTLGLGGRWSRLPLVSRHHRWLG